MLYPLLPLLFDFFPFGSSLDLRSCSRRKSPPHLPHEDADVLAEKERVANMPAADEDPRQVIRVENISKAYRGGKMAVRSVTFAAAAGDVVGLLGVNGAGM